MLLKVNTVTPLSSTTVAPKPSSDTMTTNPTPKLSRTGADMKAWANGFTNCPVEMPPTILDMQLPSDFPIGTYFRNGHGRFTADDETPVIHPFDGDGMVVAMTFDPENNRVMFRNRFVETESYIQDKNTGTMSARGLFGTRKSGGFWGNLFRTDYKHVGNTNVVHCGDSLYALWEGGKPYLLDPLTLKNKNGPGKVGETDLNGLIDNNFSAHYRYDPIQKTYVNFGNFFDPSNGATVSLFELDQEHFSSTKKTVPSFMLDAPALLHDFLITQKYCIFNINKTQVNNKAALKALLGQCGFAGVLDIDPTEEQTNIVLVPRSLMDETDQSKVDRMNIFEDDRIIVIPVKNHFNFHYVNCFEDDDGNIVFDTVQSSEIDIGGFSSASEPIWNIENVFEGIVPSSLVRYTIDVKKKCLCTENPPKTILRTRNPEFPSFPKAMSTRKHRYLYPVVTHGEGGLDPSRKGSGCAGGLAKVDCEDPSQTEFFSFEPYEFPGECVLCPKVSKDITQPGMEDACYLLVHIVNGRDKTTDFAIFDVEGKGSFEKGPILRERLPVFVPHLLHGTFAEGVTFDFDSI
jgi:all-trans-8'-apo-beta-carotenal 15,15'-oxygenase